MTNPRHAAMLHPRQGGQAIIEYLVVLSFSVMLLIRPFPASEINPNAAPGTMQGSVVDMLAQAIRDYHQHYSFAMAIAYIPNCTYTFSADQTAIQSRIPQSVWPLSSFPITASASVTFDRCFDWAHPSIPTPDNFGSSLNLNFGSVTSEVEGLITNAITNAISNFDPASALTGLIHFDPSSLF